MTSTTTQYMEIDTPDAQLGCSIAVTGNPATVDLFASDILPGAPGTVDQTLLLLGGNGPYVGPASLQGGSRWGDYSAASPDPLDAHSVWVGGEYAAYEISYLNEWAT